ncbi:MAG: GNAT family N-acetyltransferase [Planctomycetes bacterium]|nr:GNAT family N-acetyltransferase [Planctomycetota bacterium]
MDARVRLATLEDAPAIAALHVAAWRTAYRGLVPDALLDALSVAEWAAERHERLRAPAAGVRTWALDLDGALGGFAVTGPARDDDLDPVRAAEVHALYLRPDLVGRGLGRRLLDHALEDLARTRPDAVEVTLWALEGNALAARFYARAGFVPGARAVKTFRGFDLPHARWRRAVAQGL